jgi:hypothetical protein
MHCTLLWERFSDVQQPAPLLVPPLATSGVSLSHDHRLLFTCASVHLFPDLTHGGDSGGIDLLIIESSRLAG